MSKEKESKTKYRRLILETASFIYAILFVIFIILAIIVISITSFLLKTSIKDNLFVNVLDAKSVFADLFPEYEMNYLMDNKDILSDDFIKENQDSFTGGLKDYTEKSFREEDEATKKTVTFQSYQITSISLKYLLVRHERKNITVLDVSDQNNPFVVFYQTDSNSGNNIDDYYSIFALEQTSFSSNAAPFSIDDHPAVKAMMNGSNNRYEIEYIDIDGSSMTNIVLPLYDNAGVKYLLIMSDDTETVTLKQILAILYRPLFRILIGIFVIAILISAFVYYIVNKPLSQISKSIRNYTKYKNSLSVEYQMSEIKSTNEIGILANDFRELTAEIDRYNDEHIDLIQEKGKYESELNVAAKIQDDMLLKDFPDDKHFKLFASMTPAKEVGGDFYDFFKTDEDHLCITIADVAGKGVPASLVMMSTLTSIRNFATLIHEPEKILSSINEELCRKNLKDMFVTVWLGILNLKTGKLTVSSAGHEYPAINLTGEFELFKDKHSFVVGGMSGIKYKTIEFDLKKGDSVFVYTDGVPEATNAEEQLFGNDRMIEALNIAPDADPEELLKNVKASVDEFVGEAPQFDDLTMLAIKYLGND